MPTKPLRPKRSRLPALPPGQRAAFLAQLQAAGISPSGLQAIGDSLNAAANPNAERPDVVIKALPPERRAVADETLAQVSRVMGGAPARGKAALRAMSEAEWARLLEANE